MNDQAYIELWLDWYRAGNVSPNTLRTRKSHLRRLAAQVQLMDATEDDLTAFLSALSDKSANYRHSIHASFKQFYGWALRRGFRHDDPTVGLRPVPVPPGLPKPIDEVALAKALAAADGETRLMLLLGAYAGLRRAEIAAVHSDDVRGGVLYVKGKGGKERRIPIHPLLAADIGKVQGWAFPTTSTWERCKGGHVTGDYVANRLEKVLPSPWSVHSLRHRFATMAYQSAHDLRAVQTLLGHTKPETTARYTLIGHDDLLAAVNGIAA